MKTQLFLSTTAFALAFALWGSVAGIAPFLKALWGLTPLEAAFLVAIPVILGSLGRIPVGFLVDHYGPRRMMAGTLAFSGLCALEIAVLNPNYPTMLFLSALMGVSGTTFVIGIAHVSHWYPKSQQGAALGIFGLGNIGQSMSLSLIPWFASFGSWKTGFIFFGLSSLAWASLYFKKAVDSPTAVPRKKSLGEISALFLKFPMCWILSLYYFLTFGGFVAMSLYLPTLLREQFFLSPERAGMRTAGFVVLATLARPLGGYLSDRLGAQRILAFVFAGITTCSLLLMTEKIGLFSFGTFGLALCVGSGNGAVFKLVPHYFPLETGAVTGLVGAAGGLGGFFPPLVLGFSLQHYGNYLLGWSGLLMFSFLCQWVLWKTMLQERREISLVLAKKGIAIS